MLTLTACRLYSVPPLDGTPAAETFSPDGTPAAKVVGGSALAETFSPDGTPSAKVCQLTKMFRDLQS